MKTQINYSAAGICLFLAAFTLWFGVEFVNRTAPRTQLMEVTAYCPNACCCGAFADGVTASGVSAVGKLCAADKKYPFGTMITIPGYGRVPVQDRGGAIKGDRLDVLFPTHQEALNWGRRTMKVRF